MNDYIDRQAAIDAIKKLRLPRTKGERPSEGINRFVWSCAIDCAEEKIGHLPSIEPVKHGRWIPVSERLPEPEQEVLVTRHFLSDNQLKKNAITESFYVEVASRIDDEWTSYSDEYKIKRHLHKVIAWMPLPEPYAEEGEEA